MDTAAASEKAFSEIGTVSEKDEGMGVPPPSDPITSGSIAASASETISRSSGKTIAKTEDAANAYFRDRFTSEAIEPYEKALFDAETTLKLDTATARASISDPTTFVRV